MKFACRFFALIFICGSFTTSPQAFADETGDSGDLSSGLTVAKIMRDPKWIGSSPKGIFWSEDSKHIYFKWNPVNADGDSLYVVSRDGGKPRKVTLEERKALPARNGDYNKSFTKKTYAKDGDIYLLDIKRGKTTQVTNTLDNDSTPVFNLDEDKIIYEKDKNLFSWNISSGATIQITDFRKGSNKSEDEEPKGAQEKWLKEQQLDLISVLKERKEKKKSAKALKEDEGSKRPREIYLDGKTIQAITPSPDLRFVTFRLKKESDSDKRTITPNYVTESGFTEDINARTKVGREGSTYELGVYDRERDTVYYVSTEKIPGIYDQPVFLKESDNADSEKKPREVVIRGPWWSDDGKRAFVVVLSLDFKDRWIMSLDALTGALSLLDRQSDDWIGGPGIWGWTYQGEVGWTPDSKSVWFLSEKTGYSHLYTVNVSSKKKTRLTRGKFEVHDVRISRDKKHWYYISNEVHPGEQNFYELPIKGGELTRMTFADGNHDVTVSPDSKTLAIRYSFTNKPWELFVRENKYGSTPKQVTYSLSKEFKSYHWRSPKILKFKARDGAYVHARLYRPQIPQAKGPAVIFVHGAGYKQNAHRWWSSYYREYMFHNLLVDHGYTVLDIDYRGSRGYGRDWRTAIYRFMGGKDLTDQVDGAKLLVEKYDVDSARIGIYGGSYGGFITLMAMFTTPDIFAAGAALRPVTDWAHYNHGYTANILNTPATDSLAYGRSSPIYYAEGLKGALLMCHGMIDTNVHFQDVVRLAQRLIELGKENWEVAVYPLEGHGFKEPSSWTDEYRRIFKLFEDNLK